MTEIEKVQTDLINALKAQVQNHVELNAVNDKIINTQAEYIKKLEELLAESKALLEESLSLLRKQDL
jgi:hypothetical protein